MFVGVGIQFVIADMLLVFMKYNCRFRRFPFNLVLPIDLPPLDLLSRECVEVNCNFPRNGVDLKPATRPLVPDSDLTLPHFSLLCHSKISLHNTSNLAISSVQLE